MSGQRYTPEFKDEAVRQVLERGYTVADISKRLGVSNHSLYKWVEATGSTNRQDSRSGPRSGPEGVTHMDVRHLSHPLRQKSIGPHMGLVIFGVRV